MDAKEKEYKRFQGQGDEYYMHKDELKPDKKVYVQQVAMVTGAVGIIAGAFYYMKHWRNDRNELKVIKEHGQK